MALFVCFILIVGITSVRGGSWYTGSGATRVNSSSLTNRTLETMESSFALPGSASLRAWAAPLAENISRVIEIGAGEGRVLLEVQRRFPLANVTGLNRPFGRFVNVAGSGEQLAATAARYGISVEHLPAIALHDRPSSLLTNLPAESVDLIISQATFQWVRYAQREPNSQSPDPARAACRSGDDEFASRCRYDEQVEYLRESMRLLRSRPSGVALISWPFGDDHILCSGTFGTTTQAAGALFNRTTNVGAAMILQIAEDSERACAASTVLIILAKGAAAHKLHHIVQHRLPTMKQANRFFAHRYNHKHASFGDIWQGAVMPLLAREASTGSAPIASASETPTSVDM